MFGSPSTKRKLEPPRLPLPQNHGSRQQQRANGRTEKKRMDNASKYVTQAKYAGQPASVGGGVVTKIGGRVRSAVIDEIRDG